jgi:hypothetical protein
MLPAILNRLRFRFSLRALLISVAVVGVATAWIVAQLRWIDDRREIVATYLVSQVRPVHPGSAGWPALVSDRPPAPWPLGWFGEQGFGLVLLGNDTPAHEYKRIKMLFPEATVSRAVATNADLRGPKSRD